MPLTDLEILDAYDTGDRAERVIQDFYNPVLQEAKVYKRLTGYFSSQVLALAARGVAGLIKNGGKMQLIASPVVSESDYKVLSSFRDEDLQEFVNKQFEIAMGNLNDLAATIAYDHLRALGWMLRENILEIRILVPRDIDSGSGIFHSKVGVIEDNIGNIISFSGSVNETAMGWSQNIEEFKVFKSWESGSANWVKHDMALFDRYWNLSNDSGFKSMPLPKRSAEKLLAIAPNEISELDLGASTVKKKPRKYQLEAIESWSKAGFKGILEMATGTGKTFTARLCVNAWKEGKKDSVILITAPTQTIGSQWQEVMKDLNPITTFENQPWRELLRDGIANFSLGISKHVLIIAVQNTASSDDFLAQIAKLNTLTSNHLFIADEMHGLGSPIFRKALNKDFEARLGLTATPNRWFDEDGTSLLMDYFGGVVYRFGLHEALNWVDPISELTPLCPYNYYPEFVDLDSLEMEKYLELTKQIIIQSSRSVDGESDDRLRRLQDDRALILKKANDKFSSLKRVLDSLSGISGCLIYCSDREQIDQVIDIVSMRGITYRTFTGREGTSPKKEFNGMSERDWILNSFENGEIQALIAMKCLDEGVDIPSARIGIILASTTNPREFIQRRGRLLRRSKGKELAEIYDMIVAPLFDENDQSEIVNQARKILEKELQRANEFANDALNSASVSGKVLSRMLSMGAKNER
jgi:superfamily II DNA or RNA helicase